MVESVSLTHLKTIANVNFLQQPHHCKNIQSWLDIWKVETPFWRSDITLPEDLYEEIARIVGYDSIPLKFISGEIPKWEPNKLFEYKNTLRRILNNFKNTVSIDLVDMGSALGVHAGPGSFGIGVQKIMNE